MRSPAFVLLCAVLVWACARAPSEPGAEVDRLLAAAGRADAPGAAVIAIRDGIVLKRGAFGLADLERGVPITTDTAFRLASVSKQFTAMAIMMLAEQGRLAYDDPITRFLPELARFGDDLRIRHLLNHTGGLPDYYDVMVEISGVERPRTLDALAVLSRWGEPLFPPGERYEYSNPGYELLALVVERASGGSYAEFVEKRIFAPLGMTSSVVMDERSPTIAKRARGYRRDGDGFRLDDDHPLNFVIGSGGIYSSVEDLARWDRALQGERLVRRETLAEAFRRTRSNGGDEIPYGFGWRLGERGGRACTWHGGEWLGFQTFIARYPAERFSAIVLSNLVDTDAGGLADAIAELYLGDGQAGPRR